MMRIQGNSAVDTVAVMTLLAEQAKLQREDAREAARGAGRAQEQALAKAADRLRDGASTALAFGLAGAGLQVLGGAAQLGGTLHGASLMSGHTAGAATEMVNAWAGQMAQLGSSTAAVTAGLAQASQALGAYADQMARVDEQSLRAEGARQEVTAQDARARERELADHRRELIGMIGRLGNAEHDARLAILRG